jgi:hypothetical protein
MIRSPYLVLRCDRLVPLSCCYLDSSLSKQRRDTPLHAYDDSPSLGLSSARRPVRCPALPCPVGERTLQVSRASRCRLSCMEVFRLAHFSRGSMSQKSRSEKEKSGVLCAAPHTFFVLAHSVTGRDTMTDCFLFVSGASAA